MIKVLKMSAVCIVCMLCFAAGFAQTLKGKVTDSLGVGISYANVTLKSKAGIIVAYTATDQHGIYALQVPAQTDKGSLLLEASLLGYKKQILQVADAAMAYNFKLSASVSQLKAITVKDKNPRLRVHGDTTDYKVSEFSSPQDRVIGDVIKKLPGIDVAKDGKISYNGKAISGVYIGGDNLLDDKYNIATNSIPQGAVDKVQVMENHQPVKMLQNKVVSEDVALNLTMKKEAKLQVVGQESIGGGVPDRYYADLNAMMFKDKYKAINYFKLNNTANDVSADLISHNLGSYLSRLDNDKPSTVLSLGTAGDPDLPRNRYLFNKVGLLNLNNLVNLKNDVQLRANISYLRDDQRQAYTKYSEYYLPNDTIRYNELQNNRKRPDILHTQLNLNINRDKYYLNNAFVADYSRNTGYSALIANGTPVNQVLKDNLTDISNEFSLMKTNKRNRIFEFYSYLNRSTEPENRVIDPGLNPDIFNGGKAYKQLTQTVDIPRWFTNNYFSFKIPGDYLTQSYKAGFSLQSQRLTSALNVTQLDNAINLYTDSARNNLNWNRRRAYAEAAFDVPGNKLKLNVSLPLNLQQISYNDSYYKLDKELTRLYFNPQMSLKYQTSVENYVSVNYGYRNEIGNIQDVYNGYILKNYRSLYANNADLTERKMQNAMLGFTYRKAITLFFFNVSAGYTHVNANNIASSVITNNIQQRVVLPFNNNLDTWSANGSVSKYLFSLRTTVSAGVAVQTTRLNQILNGVILPYNTVSTTYSFGADTKVSDKVNFGYKASYDMVTSRSAVIDNKTKFERLLQNLAVNYNPMSNLLLTASADHYYTHQAQAADLKYIFADASARYRFSKSKVDVELSAQNLFNTKTYSALYLSANTLTSSSYVIPGRFLLAKVAFNL